MFVPHTPGGMLRRRIQKVEDVMASKKVGRVEVERGGTAFIAQTWNQAPWLDRSYGRADCFACQSKAGICKKRNSTYTIKCKTCEAEGKKRQYVGETSRTIYDRLQEHQEALEKKTDSYGVMKHWLEEHGERQSPPEYAVGFHKSHKAALHRQIWEAVEIASKKPETLLNSKTEWGVNPLPEMNTEFNTQNEIQIESEDLRKMTMAARATAMSSKRKRAEEPTFASRQDRVTESSTFEGQLAQRKRQKRREEQEMRIKRCQI